MADSKSTKSPAFQFYPNDFLADPNVVVMSLQERGAYITLLCLCWQPDGLPSDGHQLARMCGVPVTVFRKLWPALERCFRPHPTDQSRLIHPRLEKEREKQETYRRRQSDRGRMGGRPKNPDDSGNKASAFETESRKKASAFENKSLGFSKQKPDESSAAFEKKALHLQSSSSSSDQEREKDTHAMRAGQFIEAYRELHQRYRGVAYLGNPVQDYQQAQYLVAAFDDAMLEKLAVYWLNDTDDFATNGTRSLAKLRSRASKYAEELKALKLA
jgi:uncharacterized protein YdaU (DUF1376 family)